MYRLISCVLICCACVLGAFQAQSQSAFRTIVTVNDSVITQFELDQRKIILETLGSIGDLDKAAMDALIDERLYAQAARSLGISATQAQIDDGIAEFAGRGNLASEELIGILSERGVEEVSFRDFIENGVLWRTVVQSRFGRLAAVQDNDIDIALSLGASQKQLSFLLSEVILPKEERGSIETTRLANELVAELRSGAQFADTAVRYSSSPSAEKDGRRDWTPIGELTPVLVTELLTMEPGQITNPVDFANFVAIFKLHSMRAEQVTSPLAVTLNYLRVDLPGTVSATDAQVLSDDSDTCLDFRAVAEQFGTDITQEDTVTAGQLAGPVTAELAKLDRFETSTFTNSTGTTSVLMLCNRIRELTDVSRDGLRNALFSQRLTGLGSAYLQELKGQSFITRQ